MNQSEVLKLSNEELKDQLVEKKIKELKTKHTLYHHIVHVFTTILGKSMYYVMYIVFNSFNLFNFASAL